MLAYLKAHGELLITLSAIIGGLGILITINGNRFNAQDKLIAQGLDAQERLMNQRFEAQEKLMNQRFEAQEKLMNQRFEAQEKFMNQRFDAQDRLMNQRFEQVNLRFEAQEKLMNQRFDRLTDEIADLRGIMVGVSERVSRNEGEIDVIREHLRIADTPSP